MFHNRTWPLATSAFQRARQDRTSLLTPAEGGGSGVTVSPLPNWGDYWAPGTSVFQQIQGIGSTITLSTTPTGLSGFDTFIVYVNSSPTTVGATTKLLSRTATDTFTVGPNQYVAFQISFTVTIGQVEVRNTSDANKLLDTILYDTT